MSSVAISYGNLDNAGNGASKVSKKLTSYADSIQKNVLNKLDNYNGDYTGNISNAKTKMSQKKHLLEAEADDYTTYAQNLKNLKDNCMATDKNVAKRISSLTGTFKESHGINNSWIANTFGNLLTGISNSNPVFRWIDNNVVDWVKEKRQEIKGAIKEWYNYKGGKQLIKGSAVAILEIAAGIIGIIGAFASGGALILVIAGLCTAIIGTVNGITNLINEGIAYNARQNGNASMGYRFSALNEYTETLTTISDDKGIHKFATVIDTIETVCEVIDFVHGADELLKNGYKWATGCADSLSDISRKDVLSKNTFKSFYEKIKTNMSQGADEITSAIKRQDYNFFKDNARIFFSDFSKSLKDRYLFDSSLQDPKKILDNHIDVTGNIVSFSKGIIEDGLISTLKDEAILPSLNIFSVDNWKTDDNGNYIKDTNGKRILGEKTEITLDDIISVPKDFCELTFSKGPDLIKKLYEKNQNVYLMKTSYIPEIKLNISISIDVKAQVNLRVA